MLASSLQIQEEKLLAHKGVKPHGKKKSFKKSFKKRAEDGMEQFTASVDQPSSLPTTIISTVFQKEVVHITAQHSS